MNIKQHSFSQDNVSVLDREPKWFQRGVKEAVHIAASRPSLKRDRGRHILPAAYNSLVQLHDVSSSHSRTLSTPVRNQSLNAEENGRKTVESYAVSSIILS